MRIIEINKLEDFRDDELNGPIIRAALSGANHAMVGFGKDGIIDYKGSKINIDEALEEFIKNGYIARKGFVEHNGRIIGSSIIVNWDF